MALGNISAIKISMTMALLFAISISMTGATVHTVGYYGWSLPRHHDYDKWSASNKFFIGDKLVFNYDPEYHSVLEVNEQQFYSCDRTSPISSYASGNDTIALERLGYFFFICGVPDHCESGQKLRLHVENPNNVDDPHRGQ